MFSHFLMDDVCLHKKCIKPNCTQSKTQLLDSKLSCLSINDDSYHIQRIGPPSNQYRSLCSNNMFSYHLIGSSLCCINYRYRSSVKNKIQCFRNRLNPVLKHDVNCHILYIFHFNKSNKN